MFSRISKDKQKEMLEVESGCNFDWRTLRLWTSFYENQAHHVEWVLAFDSSENTLIFDDIWLEENKSPCPLLEV